MCGGGGNSAHRRHLVFFYRVRPHEPSILGSNIQDTNANTRINVTAAGSLFLFFPFPFSPFLA